VRVAEQLKCGAGTHVNRAFHKIDRLQINEMDAVGFEQLLGFCASDRPNLNLGILRLRPAGNRAAKLTLVVVQ